MIPSSKWYSVPLKEHPAIFTVEEMEAEQSTTTKNNPKNLFLRDDRASGILLCDENTSR